MKTWRPSGTAKNSRLNLQHGDLFEDVGDLVEEVIVVFEDIL